MEVRIVEAWNTNQPYRAYALYELTPENGVPFQVTVRMGGWSETWDLQPFRMPTHIIEGPKGPEVVAALKAAFPNSAYIAELE